jgi:hypothetical protein
MKSKYHAIPLLLAGLAAAQSIDTWTTGPWNVGAFANGVSLSGPAGFGVIAASWGLANPPVPTPFGSLWLAGGIVTLASGPVPSGGALTTWLTIPPDPSYLGARLTFQSALLPTAPPGAVLLSGACTRRIGPLVSIGPLTPYNNELFGRSLAAGDRNGDGVAELAVGAPGAWNAIGTVPGLGAVGVYAGNPLALVQTLSGVQGNANFGNSVAMAQVDGLSGLDLIVGEPRYDLSLIDVDFGRVHVFYAPAYATSSTISFLPPAGGVMQHFGFEVLGVDFDGNGLASVVVGAPALGSTPSRVHVYEYGVGGVLALGYSLTNPNGTSGDYGRALASANLVTSSAALELCVGDRSYAPAGGSSRGRVYLYAGTALVASLDSPAAIDYGFFGQALATADFTGDGVADLAVGAPGEGNVYLYPGGATGLGAPTVLTFPGPGTATGFGTALLAADANGDGARDLVVGVLPSSGVGQAVVFLGTTGGANTFQVLAQVMDWDSTANLFGTAFAAGDTDGDGTPELFGGAPTKSVGFLTQGLVYKARL